MIELLVAAICLAVAALSITAALRFSNDRIVQAEARMVALDLARNEVEKAKGKAFRGILLPLPTVTTTKVAGVTMTTTTTVTIVPGFIDVYKVSVTVSYDPAGTPSQNVTLVTEVRNGSVS